MKLKNLLFVLCLALLAGCQKDPDTESTPAPDTDRVEGVIRLKFDRETAEALNVTRTRSGRILTGNISFDELCERYDVTGMERLFADNGCAERTRKAGLDLWYTIRFEGSARQVLDDFGEIPGVAHVEIPRRITKIGGISRKNWAPSRELMALPKAVPSNYPFNDPLFAEQWPLYNDGSVYEEARSGADINVIPAWTKTAGRSDVIVAVVDEGVEYTHPDLATNMWSGIGKNFCSGYNEDITWGQGHGTHVAGTIAAVNNNDVGISGMAGGTGSGDGVKIMDLPPDGRTLRCQLERDGRRHQICGRQRRCNLSEQLGIRGRLHVSGPVDQPGSGGQGGDRLLYSICGHVARRTDADRPYGGWRRDIRGR